jgi:hypothetical protein
LQIIGLDIVTFLAGAFKGALVGIFAPSEDIGGVINIGEPSKLQGESFCGITPKLRK